MNDTKSAAFLSLLSQLEDSLRAGASSLEKLITALMKLYKRTI